MTPTRLEELARERSGRNQHYVACTLYLAAAAGQGGSRQAATSDLTMARIERKLGQGDKLSFAEKISKGASAAIGLSKPAAPPNAMEAGALSTIVIPGGQPGSVPGAQMGQGGPGQMAQGVPGPMAQGGPALGAPAASPNGFAQPATAVVPVRRTQSFHLVLWAY